MDAEDDTTRRIVKVVNETLDLVRALGQSVTGLRADVTGLRTDMSGLRTDMSGLRTELTTFRGEVQDDFAIVKARLRRIETTLTNHEERVSALEQGRKNG